MAKGNILSDSFEQLVELGQSTVKKGSKQVAQTFSPLKILENINPTSGESSASSQKEKSAKKNDSSPLDFAKLQEKYQGQDKIKMDSLRNRLFQIVRREDEKLLERKKMDQQQKKQKEAADDAQKKQEKAKQQQLSQSDEEPRGRIRRSIFSPKKVAKRQLAEVRPSAGKQ